MSRYCTGEKYVAAVAARGIVAVAAAVVHTAAAAAHVGSAAVEFGEGAGRCTAREQRS